MKKYKPKLSIVITLLILFATSSSLFAQRGLGRGYGRGSGQGYWRGSGQGLGLGAGQGLGLGAGQGLGLRNNVLGGQGFLYGIPDLTEEQEASIIELRSAYLIGLNEIQNQIAEKQLQINLLYDANEPNTEAISKHLEETSKLENQLILKGITFNKGIRDLLNDEQKVFF